MTTVVVVKKAGQIAIAADYPGDLRRHALSHRLRGQHQDLQGRDRRRAQLHRHGRHRGALPGAAQGDGLDAARDPALGSKDEVFDTFTKLHPYLKDNFFLQTKEEDSDPYESSQFSVVIANATASTACTATARCSSSRSSGASGPGAASRWAPCTPATTS
jgi:ATP-dependent HslUV protease subunit HslV